MKWMLLFVSAATAVSVFNGEDNLAMETQNADKPQSRKSAEHPAYFSNIQSNGQTSGYSGYVHHAEEVDAITKGSSMDLKKIVPKSTVHVEMFHDQPDQKKPAPFTQQNYSTVQQQSPLHLQQLQKEVAHNKLKNKPPKFYQETLSTFMKGKTTLKVPMETNSVIKPFPSSTYATPTINKQVKTLPKRNLNRQKFEYTQPTKSTYIPNNQKGETFGSQSTSHSSIVPYPTTGQAYNARRPTSGASNPWKSLSDNVEIAGSREVQLKSKRSRKPKEVGSDYLSSHKKYFVKDENSGFTTGNDYVGAPKFNADPFGDERFKAERFDHEKALKGSTPFNIENAVTLNNHYQNEGLRVEDLSKGLASFHSLNTEELKNGLENLQLTSSLPLKSFGAHHQSNAHGLSEGLGSFQLVSSDAQKGSVGSFQKPSFDGMKDGFGNFQLPNSDALKNFQLQSSGESAGGLGVHFTNPEEHKLLDFQGFGSSRAPVQFGGQQTEAPTKQSNFQFHTALPVMTEEEFEKTFGKMPKKEVKITDYSPKGVANRVPFDYRSLPKSQFSNSPPQSLKNNQLPHLIHSQQSQSSSSYSQSPQISQLSQLSQHFPQKSGPAAYSNHNTHSSQFSQQKFQQHHPKFSPSQTSSSPHQISALPQHKYNYSPKGQQQAHSFSLFGGSPAPEWAKPESSAGIANFKYPTLSRKSAGRVLDSEETPQQFSVSASYQIDRSHQT